MSWSGYIPGEILREWLKAEQDAQCGGLHQESLCGLDCSGCVGEGEGGP